MNQPRWVWQRKDLRPSREEQRILNRIEQEVRRGRTVMANGAAVLSASYGAYASGCFEQRVIGPKKPL